MTGDRVLFILFLFLGNVIQTITGFAGVILAIPFCARYAGLGPTIAVVNFVSIFTAVFILARQWRRLRAPLVRRLVSIMLPGLLVGIVLAHHLRDFERVQRLILGLFVIAVGLSNLFRERFGWRWRGGEWGPSLLLFVGGVFHGMFASGGALLVLYLARSLRDKDEFRAHISLMWVILNSINLVAHVRSGAMDGSTFALTLACLPAMALSMWLGGALVKRMSQEFFVRLTNVLLVLTGISLIA